MPSQHANVICCNDSVEAVVLDDDKVEEVIARMASDHYASLILAYGSRMTKKSYMDQYYWHHHRVEIVE